MVVLIAKLRIRLPLIQQVIFLLLFPTGHEVIRGAMLEVEEALNKKDKKEAKSLWLKLQLWGNIHRRMEEGSTDGTSPIGLFRLLDQACENIAEGSDLRNQHNHLYEYEEDINDAFAHPTNVVSESVKATFASFKRENLHHLEVEEKVMMPSIMKLATSGKPMKKYMLEEIFPLIPDENLEFFIKFANEILQRHEDGMPRVRVFNHALWGVASTEQWYVWDQWIREVLNDDKYNELQGAIAAWKAHQQQEQQQQPAPSDSEPAKQEQAEKEKFVDVDLTRDAMPPHAKGCCAIL